MKLFPLVTCIFPCFASTQALGKGTQFTINFAGRGCPIGSVSATMSPDAEFMTFGFDKMHAYTGPGYDPTVRSQNCSVHFIISLPNSHIQYAFAENTYHGYERLDQNITLTLLSTFYRSDDAGRSTTTSVVIQGSGSGQVFSRTVAVPESEYLWSKCGTNSTLWTLNERASLTSRGRNVEGRFGGDDTDAVSLIRRLRLL
ncbi:hypothetical protein QBC41DRAFT_328243 [Cercophora samala]|uniref:CUB domain-containing protein n=1 Tax=Cercophora samala TaxID=330535 RepID=A0AA39Z6U5_9PEZI|nr:hypothetical protein QBC41DRAFT_328243 [Cercophora samala]